jgi:hypothetical protein
MTEKLHAYVDSLRSKNADWVIEVIEAHGEVSALFRVSDRRNVPVSQK